MFWSGGNLVRPLACKAGSFKKNSSNEMTGAVVFHCVAAEQCKTPHLALTDVSLHSEVTAQVLHSLIAQHTDAEPVSKFHTLL